MARDQWFRNNDWCPEIERAFNERLQRARPRSRPQYLRLQAHHLRERNPDAALGLLERYFALGDDLGAAQAWVDRANAYLSRGDTARAVAAYEMALERERVFPSLKTQAGIELPFLIATRKLEYLYQKAIEVLDASHDRWVFPIERYRAHGARALILAASGEPDRAKENAAAALAAARETQSGFRYHRDLGLVATIDDDFGKRLQSIAGAG